MLTEIFTDSERLAPRREAQSLLIRPVELGTADQLTRVEQTAVKSFSGTIEFPTQLKNKPQSWLRRQWVQLENFVGINPHFTGRLRDVLEAGN